MRSSVPRAELSAATIDRMLRILPRLLRSIRSILSMLASIGFPPRNPPKLRSSFDIRFLVSGSNHSALSPERTPSSSLSRNSRSRPGNSAASRLKSARASGDGERPAAFRNTMPARQKAACLKIASSCSDGDAKQGRFSSLSRNAGSCRRSWAKPFRFSAKASMKAVSASVGAEKHTRS